MEQNQLSLGGFEFDRQASRLILRSLVGAVSTDLEGFLRGAKHLLKMDFDLEGAAELDGGLVFCVEGQRILLRLGQYAESFPADSVAALFNRMASLWGPEPENL
jgi:hypothetical protein